jgi:hypothetical protein
MFGLMSSEEDLDSDEDLEDLEDLEDEEFELLDV